MTSSRVWSGGKRRRAVWSRPSVYGPLLAAMCGAVGGAVGCVGDGAHHTTTDAGFDAAECMPCGRGCFDCGSGCECPVPDAGPIPWNAPFAHNGPAGTWRDDTPSFCAGSSGLNSIEVWSDERGVFVLTVGSSAVNPLPPSQANGASDGGAAGSSGAAGRGGTGGFDEDQEVIGGFGGGVGGTGVNGSCVGGTCPGETLFFNDGEAGWQKLVQIKRDVTGNDMRRLHGIPSGPLVLHGGIDPTHGSPGCAFGMFDAGTFECLRASGDAQTFHAVSPTLAYASADDVLLTYDGTAWSLIDAPAPAVIVALWADEDAVVAVSQAGLLMTFQEGAWTEQATNVTEVSALWATSPTDVWLGTFFGELIHVTEAATSAGQLSAPCGSAEIRGIWGAGDSIYYYGPTDLHRIRDGVDEALGAWSCDMPNVNIDGLWGNAADEVFVATRDFNRQFVDSCGEVFIHYFDGDSFHRL